MIRNTKAKGSRNERKSIALFEGAGYCCMKAGASLGVFDVICVGSQDIVLCQVKSNRNPGSVEIENIKEFKAPPNARKLIHIWDDYARVPRVREL